MRQGGQQCPPDHAMKIKVTRAFYLVGEVQPIDTVIEVPDTLARELIHLGKANAVTEAPAETERPARGRRASAD